MMIENKLSEVGLRSNMAYAKAMIHKHLNELGIYYEMYNRCHDVIHLPKLEKIIKQWNAAIRSTNNKQAKGE
jgi:hypothetical protein